MLSMSMSIYSCVRGFTPQGQTWPNFMAYVYIYSVQMSVTTSEDTAILHLFQI